MELYWQYKYEIGNNAYRFQIQISEDSLMRWLVYGSRDGYTSKYRQDNNPDLTGNNMVSLVPEKIRKGFEEGKFDNVLGEMTAKEIKFQIENFFAGVFIDMQQNNFTFAEGVKHRTKGDAQELLNIISALYKPEGDILNADVEQYLKITQLKADVSLLLADTTLISRWKFMAPIKLQNNKPYFWRVRAKDKDVVMSHWSAIESFKLK
jgi:hypothetical protein